MTQEDDQAAMRVDAAVLGDVDAWDVQRDGDWYRFHARLPGKQGTRLFRRRVSAVEDGSAPDIFADPTGALFAVLSLGGARRALTSDDKLRFPYHVVTCGDEFGPAGAVGTETNPATDVMQRPWEQTRDTLIADEIIAMRHAAFRALPLIYARGEADSSADMASFETGLALGNFEQIVANLVASANSLGLPAKVLAVSLDFVAEDVSSDPDRWISGMRALMSKITAMFSKHGLRKPLFVMGFDAGSAAIVDGPVLRAQWELVWNVGDHDILYTAPRYMFAQDRFGRLKPEGSCHMAEMEACAIEAANSDDTWACPLFLLAEREEDGRIIRCRGQALGPLVIDESDPLGAGPFAGFKVEGSRNGAQVIGVEIAQDDPQDVLVRCDRPPKGHNVKLLYALGRDGGNLGGVRDTWSRKSRTGATLHRWAHPAALPIN